jgi:hypothetical protein
MKTDQALRWVTTHMPKESADALALFTQVNPHWRGAGWDDCLAILLDSDSNLEVTEPMYDDIRLSDMGSLPAAVALTCFYASKTFAEAPTEIQTLMVAATIDNNGGPE